MGAVKNAAHDDLELQRAVDDGELIKLSPAEKAAWAPALNAAYTARGNTKRVTAREFDMQDVLNVMCMRAARGLMPNEGATE